MSDETRTAVKEIEIAAPAEAVWNALTDAEEISRWFSLDADVTPGAGGRMWWSWGERYEWESRIEVWEPGVHLRTVYTLAAPGARPDIPSVDAADRLATVPGTELVMDFFIEARGGITVLRVVHSGFGTDASWDTEYDGVRRGWHYELRSLRHYLERHPGVTRSVAWARKAVSMTGDEVWARVMSVDGFLGEKGIAGLVEGDEYSLRTSLGDVFNGIVTTIDPPFEFSGTVANLGDALFRVEFYEASVLFWVATYALSPDRVAQLQKSLEALLERLFPSEAGVEG